MATQETPRRKLVNMTAFFVFAFIEQSLFVVIGISAAEDILTQTNVPTSVVLVSITGPYFLVTLLVPPFVHSIPLSIVVLVESCFFVIGLLLVAVTQNLVSRLIGVSLVSSACSLGDISFLAWTSCYEEDTVRAFTAGSGAGVWLLTLYYLGMLLIFIPWSSRDNFFAYIS